MWHWYFSLTRSKWRQECFKLIILISLSEFEMAPWIRTTRTFPSRIISTIPIYPFDLLLAVMTPERDFAIHCVQKHLLLSPSQSVFAIGGWIINSSFTAKGQTDLECCVWTSTPNPQTIVVLMSPMGAIQTQFSGNEHYAVRCRPEPLPSQHNSSGQLMHRGGKTSGKALLSGNVS